MNKLSMKPLMDVVMDCLELQMRSSRDWHYGDAAYETDEIPEVEGLPGLRELVMRQHWTYFRLHHVREEGTSPTRQSILEDKMERVTLAVNTHMLSLLESMGLDATGLEFGGMMAKMSELSLAAHHAAEEAKTASGEAAHESENVKLARVAECAMEKVGELNTHRMVQGREMLDALMECAGNSLK